MSELVRLDHTVAKVGEDRFDIVVLERLPRTMTLFLDDSRLHRLPRH